MQLNLLSSNYEENENLIKLQGSYNQKIEKFLKKFGKNRKNVNTHSNDIANKLFHESEKN